MGTQLAGCILDSLLFREGSECFFLSHEGPQGGAPSKLVAVLTVSEKDAQDRFLKKSEILKKISHDNLLRTHDFGREGKQAFAIHEYVPGLTLRESVKDRPLPVDAALTHGLAVLEALEFIHRAGLVHGGIRPEWILEGDKSRTVLLPPVVAAQGSADQVITGGALRGINFMSPEQVKNRRDPNALTPRSDLYSLGAVIFFLLTGKRPFDSPSPAITRKKILSDELDSPAQVRQDLPREVESIVRKAMAKAPEQRYHSARDMAEDILRFLKGNKPKALADAKGLSEKDLKTPAAAVPSSVAPLPSLGFSSETEASKAKKARMAISRHAMSAFTLDDEPEQAPTRRPVLWIIAAAGAVAVVVAGLWWFLG